MNSQHFYVTLPCTASLQTYPNNSPSRFKTVLSKPLVLKGQWEVCLSEILFTHSFYNVNRGHDNLVIYNEGIPHKHAQAFDLKAGFYEDGRDILKEIRKGLSETASERIDFNIDGLTRRTEIKVKDGAQLVPSRHVLKLLGFKNDNQVIDKDSKSDLPADTNRDMHAFYVYCDIIEPVIVGDQEVPLLKIVDVPHKKVNEVITRNYSAAQYLPLRTNHIQVIEINISWGDGSPVHFQGGTSMVRLHFKKVSPFAY